MIPKASELHYRLFFEAGAEGMLLASADGVLLDANPQACSILGREREELLTAGLQDLFDTSDPRSEFVLGGRSAGKTRGLELRLLRNGTPFTAEVSLAKHRNGDGEDLLCVVFRERGEVGGTCSGTGEEGTQLGQALVERGSDLLTLCNADNTIRYISPSVEHILGYDPEELVGVFVPDLVHPDDLAFAAGEVEGIVRNRQSKPGPVRYRHKHGSWVYLESTFDNLLSDPNVRGIVCNSRDVTERVLAEQEVRRLNETLERRVAARTGHFEALVEELRHKERVLRRSEERFRMMVQEVTDYAIFMLDPEGRVVSWNAGAERSKGYTEEEIVGQHFSRFYTEEDVERDWPGQELRVAASEGGSRTRAGGCARTEAGSGPTW